MPLMDKLNEARLLDKAQQRDHQRESAAEIVLAGIWTAIVLIISSTLLVIGYAIWIKP